MALTVNTNIINDTDQYLLDAKNVKGSYVVVTSADERDTLPAATTVKGSLCYVTGTAAAPVNKFYQYNGTSWVEKEFGTTTEATTSAAGLMSAADKTKLTGIASGAEVNVQADWNETNTSSDAYIKNKPALKTVATSGSYNDLTDKPTIPTVNNATLTIQKNGTTVATFTANSSTNQTANITVPTKTSDLANDSGFITDFTEEDPTVPSHVKSITSTNVANWDTAYTHSQNPHAPSDAEKNVQSDWAVTDTSSDAYIKNKPTIPTALKNPNALSIGGKSYDGSSAVSVTAADLGIANAIHFIGETTTALTDGATTAAVTIDGASKTPASGDVVLYGSKEFIWNGSAWKELGDGASHALKTVTITAGNGLTGGGDISTNRTLNVGAGNGITVSADAVAAKAGNGITVDSTGINHADTSSQASVTANGRKYITGVTLDTYGHVTGLTTGTETVTDNNQKVKTGSVTFGANDVVEFKASSNVSISGDATNKTITISATNSNTDKDIMLSETLYTYTPIGKAQTASNTIIGSGSVISNTNPGKLGDAGDSLKAVFNKVFGTQQDQEPNITNNVKLTANVTGATSYTSGEYGEVIDENYIDITFTLANTGTAPYGYRCEDAKTTGSQTFYYPINKQSTGTLLLTADLKITLPSGEKATSSMVTAGTFVKADNNVLYCNFTGDKQVSIRIKLPAGSFTDEPHTRYGQITGGVTLDDATNSAGTKIDSFLTYLGKDAKDNSKLSVENPGKSIGPYTISAGSYSPYYLASASDSLTSVAKNVATKFTSGSAVSIDCATDSYIWFLMIPGTSGSKTIQYEALGQWYDFNGGTTGPVDVSLTLNSGATATYKGYHTNKQASAGTTKFKII